MSDEYKVRGRIAAPNGSGVVGHNTATSGTPVGVEGAVDAAGGYGLYTDDDAGVGGTLETSALEATDIAVSDAITVDYTGSSQTDHGLEVIDRQEKNAEQVSIKADADGTAELVFQDIGETRYKWGLRVGNDNLTIDDHSSLQTRLEFVKDGDTHVYGGGLVVHEPLSARGTFETDSLDDAGSGSVTLRTDVDCGGRKLEGPGKHVAHRSTDATLDPTTDDLVVVDTSDGDRTVSLPTDAPEGVSFTVKKSAAANTLAVDGNGNDVDGAAAVTLDAEHESVVLTVDAAGDWWIESRYSGDTTA